MAERFIVRCDTPPHAAAWNEHQAVPTVASESRSSAIGSNNPCFGGASGRSVFLGSPLMRELTGAPTRAAWMEWTEWVAAKAMAWQSGASAAERHQAGPGA